MGLRNLISSNNEKIDDMSWHFGPTGDNEIQAATHIGMAIVWLLGQQNNTNLSEDIKKSFTEKSISPAHIAINYFDGKMFATQSTPRNVSKFLKDIYIDQYLKDYENRSIPGVKYDEFVNHPYSMSDTWENARMVSEYFDSLFAEWSS